MNLFPPLSVRPRLLPLVMALLVFPLMASSQENGSANNTPLGSRLKRGMNLQLDAKQKQSRRENMVIHKYEKVELVRTETGEYIASVQTTPPQSDRGLNLAYQSEAQKKLARSPQSYDVFRHERRAEVVLATGPRRYTIQQKVRTFDLYTDTEKTRPVQRKIENNDEHAASILWAEQITGRPDRQLNLDNLVEIEKGQTRITGDQGTFRQVENEVDVLGHVTINRDGNLFKAESISLNLDTGEGLLDEAKYEIEATGGRGKAERIELLDGENYNIVRGTYSTCEGNNPDWYLTASTLDLDSARSIGTAKTPVLYFKGMPILAATSLTFPLSGERKSGLLTPTMGMTSKGGFELGVPYYFNLAPNYDLTLFPKYFTKRGFQLGALGRYMGNSFEGETFVEYLPSDNEANRDRYALSTKHTHDFAPGWNYQWNFNKASDDKYPDDFSSPVLNENGRLLRQEGALSYRNPYLNVSAGASRYQVLQDENSPITNPYDRLPFVHIDAHNYDFRGLDLKAHLQYTRFWLSDEKLLNRQRGDRYVFNPEIAFPMISSGYFFTPKASLHYTQYELDDKQLNHSLGQEKSMSRSIPTLSLDTGLVLERDASFFGSEMRQTLEPRLFYVYTPYRDQRKYPVFDSGEPSFGYAQLFETNRFVGDDRISDANNLTAAITSRYIEQSGVERMRFTIGQRYYFDDQRVGLYSTADEKNENRSDLLLMASGLLTHKLAVDASIQYNQSTNRTYSSNYSVQWRPGERKILNAEYRYLRNTVDQYGQPIDQINLSGQWPIADRWYAVGQVSYSLPDNKTIESLFGVEYNADCWIARIVAQRYATSSSESNTALFFQLELKGLGAIGSSPLEKLRKNIPGYHPITQYDE